MKSQSKNIPELNSVSTVFSQFDILDRALIDTSSLIYLSKIRILSVAAQTLRLMTVPGVIKEFGSVKEIERIEIVELNEIQTVKEDTDLHLVETAKHLRLPLISEDKQMLMQAKRSGLPFFNTLMVMNFLAYKNVIDPAMYQDALLLLQDEAYYDAFIFEYGKMVYEKITEKNRTE